MNSISDLSESPLKKRHPRIDEILDVAAQVFLENGYERTSVGAIAKLAKASKDTFYSRFPTKAELFHAVMVRLMNRFAEKRSHALRSGGPTRSVLSAYGRLILERSLSDEGTALLRIVYTEAARFPEIARVFYELGPQRTDAALAEYLAEEMRQNRIRRVDPNLATEHFMGLVVTDWITRKSLGLLGATTEKQVTHRVMDGVDAFLRAYGTECEKD